MSLGTPTASHSERYSNETASRGRPPTVINGKRSMSDDSLSPHGIAHSTSRTLFRYWEKVRGERSAPLRSAMSLQPIRHLLPWIFISEPAPERSTHRLRLAGTGVCQLWGENMTGKDLFARWSKFERETMNKLLNSAIIDQQPFVMRCRARSQNGLMANLEIIGLPVESDDSGKRQVLGLTVPFVDAELLRNDRLVSFELVSIRIIWIEPLPQPNTAQPLAGKTHLQLIHGGRGR
jgi:hypothetical protein